MTAALLYYLGLTLHLTAFAVITLRVIWRKADAGTALSWIALVGLVPLAGVLFYLLVGERRIGQGRARRLADLRVDYDKLADAIIEGWLTHVDWSRRRPEAEAMNRLGERLVGMPTVGGCSGELVSDSGEILERIAADIDDACSSVLMEFYIWAKGGRADDVVDALVRAAGRGVACRVLVDAVGAHPWWRGPQSRRLREAGVELRVANSTGLWQLLFARNDLRLHRKIVVVDGEVAWTGSMNLVDPRFFKQESGVGQWVDAMYRAEGSVVAPLTATVLGDWLLETHDTVERALEYADLDRVAPKGDGDIQVVPSGPADNSDGLLQMLLAMINAARDELVLTTPYFVPDESIVRALRGAAARGVDVRLIVPEKIDSLLTRYASRSYFDELHSAGVKVCLFHGGLLHTKSITADGSISMFGTVNLDMRSLWLNYEVSLFVYGDKFGGELRALQQTYLDHSHAIDPDEWARRPIRERLMENTLRLMGPLL
ncbi:Cardiolipin synthase [Pseudobythopirellula maris]|uniref:Cardiolipin synthase n=1 Tax=Pseudobythopirellula maris TaxID=2527991 RepID=A0A5C5ZMJ2_9BACT|nr:cardiolipin synthase [Pseudobythopirellula maris]TWT88081.1 Cardiolipin synthase [Pseudobythopirellula maris]